VEKVRNAHYYVIRPECAKFNELLLRRVQSLKVPERSKPRSDIFTRLEGACFFQESNSQLSVLREGLALATPFCKRPSVERTHWHSIVVNGSRNLLLSLNLYPLPGVVYPSHRVQVLRVALRVGHPGFTLVLLSDQSQHWQVSSIPLILLLQIAISTIHIQQRTTRYPMHDLPQ
jgi:hypothetical protein